MTTHHVQGCFDHYHGGIAVTVTSRRRLFAGAGLATFAAALALPVVVPLAHAEAPDPVMSLYAKWRATVPWRPRPTAYGRIERGGAARLYRTEAAAGPQGMLPPVQCRLVRWRISQPEEPTRSRGECSGCRIDIIASV